MKRTWTLILCFLAVAASARALTTDEWRKDLKVFEEELPKTHANLFHAMTEHQFHDAVRSLDGRLPSLSREQVIVELMRIVAQVGDGHTALTPLFDPAIGFHYYPLQLYCYEDGIFVQEVSPEHKRVVGMKLIRIGDTPIDDAYRMVSAVVARENEMGAKWLAPFYLVMPEVLQSLGIISDPQAAKFVFESGGRQVEEAFAPAGAVTPIYHGFPMNTQGWVDARAAGETPLYMKNPSAAYWYEYLPDKKVLYVQYNRVDNSPEEPLAAFVKRLFAFVEANPVDKFVLDVRFNSGGNNYLNKPLIVALIQAQKINVRGKLFVILGRDTFSACQNLVNELEKYTNVLFVGESTSQNVNFYGDHVPVQLPNSKLTVMVSTLWWQNMDPRDTRKGTSPQISAPLSSADYAAGVDPAMNAILTCNYDSVSAVLASPLAAGDMEAARKALLTYRNDPGHGCVSMESDLNSLGYSLLQSNRMQDAIQVFQWNVESYPRSANVYDSLAEAYMKHGDRELAIQNYRKSLELNPDNGNAKNMLKNLEKP